ncbi:hypothetical protein Goklo_015419, partial [Gossypium klotzschianum]|nr:hypothetical protein [Gossypium klotzschianum]
EERKISLAPHCGSNPPILDPESGGGHVEKLADFNTYVSGSPECKHAVLLASDVYDAGFYAVVPDFFNGEPYDPNNPDRPKDAWMKDHSPVKGFEDAKLMIDALKSKGFSSIGAAGFCWGAKAVVELTKAELIQAAVILHPSYVTVADIK